MSTGQLRIRSAVRFTFLTLTLGAVYVLAHLVAALPLLVVGL
jgi:hypothetical protein